MAAQQLDRKLDRTADNADTITNFARQCEAGKFIGFACPVVTMLPNPTTPFKQSGEGGKWHQPARKPTPNKSPRDCPASAMNLQQRSNRSGRAQWAQKFALGNIRPGWAQSVHPHHLSKATGLEDLSSIRQRSELDVSDRRYLVLLETKTRRR
jgi:hypothetical protein